MCSSCFWSCQACLWRLVEPENNEQGSTGEAARTVEVTKTVTVVKTVQAEGQPAPDAGGMTRGSLPGPAVPQADQTLKLGDEANLESGGNLTLVSAETGVPEDEALYRPGRGMEFFVIEAEACVPESADSPVFFSPEGVRAFGVG